MSILRIRDHPTRPSTYFFFLYCQDPWEGGEPNEYPYNARDGYRAGTRKSTFNIALMHDGEFIFRFCFFVDHCSPRAFSTLSRHGIRADSQDLYTV